MHSPGKREFDFGKYMQRHVALEVLYLGWDYHGFAAVDNSDNTIEATPCPNVTWQGAAPSLLSACR